MKISNNAKPFYTFKEAGQIIGKSHHSIRQYVKHGILKAFQFSNVMVIQAEDLEAFIKRGGLNKEEREIISNEIRASFAKYKKVANEKE